MIFKEIEKKLLTDPDPRHITPGYVVARNPRVELGYPVQSGFAYWPLSKAKKTA